ncbi:hypothetical protein MYOV003v1_p0043 [Vibrio phage 207E48.1]|nr:hypothetical protein MYOV003v1_p0043 [Vibrio phage 207E48.1]
MKKLIHIQNIAAIEAAVQAYTTVYVGIVTGINGVAHPNIAQPLPEFTHEMKFGDDLVITMVTINLGGNACKSFHVDDETGDMVFDVGMGGRPFLGNIPAGHVITIGVGDDPMSLEQLPTPCGLMYLAESDDVVVKQPERATGVPKRQAFKPTIVK